MCAITPVAGVLMRRRAADLGSLWNSIQERLQFCIFHAGSRRREQHATILPYSL